MKRLYACALLLAGALLPAGVRAARAFGSGDTPPTPAAIGSTVEDFKLPDADGRERSLSSLKGTKGTVLLFIATRCPVSNAYNERMEKLAEDLKARGVNVVGINSNSTEPLAEVKQHASEHKFSFVVLKDEGNRIADRLGATVTPEAFLLDPSSKLLYRGRIDDAAPRR